MSLSQLSIDELFSFAPRNENRSPRDVNDVIPKDSYGQDGYAKTNHKLETSFDDMYYNVNDVNNMFFDTST